MVTTAISASLFAAVVCHFAVLTWPFASHDWFQLFGSPSHRGDEFFAQDWTAVDALGAVVLAPIDGEVVQAEWSCSGFGKTVVIYDQRNRLAVRVAHLDRMTVDTGRLVARGRTLIGTVGRSGSRGGCEPVRAGPSQPHLHLAAYRIPVSGIDGRPVTVIDLSELITPFSRPFFFQRK